MAKRGVYHITPNSGGGWDVKKEGNQKASGHFDRKSDAVSRGKGLAKNQALGQIKIHGRDGKIQTEHTYKKDPEKYPG